MIKKYIVNRKRIKKRDAENYKTQKRYYIDTF